jgi:putative endonuclease
MFYVYILASDRNGTLYVGQTDDLIERVRQHREKERRGFSAKYGANRLVWFEEHLGRESALTRERQIKKWYRAWKLRTIEAANPEWRDLYDDLLQPEQPLHPALHTCAAAKQTSLDPRMRGDDRNIDG